MSTLRLTFTLDVELFDGLPRDAKLDKVQAYLDMQLNEYCDGRHHLAVEAFGALMDVRYAMRRAVADGLEARWKEAGEAHPPGFSSRAAGDRVAESYFSHRPLEFQGVELID